MRWVAGWAAARASSLSPCGDGCKTLGELSAKPGQRPLNFSGLTAQMLCRSLNGGRSVSDKNPIGQELQEFQQIAARGLKCRGLLVHRFRERVRDGGERHFHVAGEERTATHSDTSQVCLVADECERLDFWILVEPARQCCHLCESAKPAGRDMLYVVPFALKQNKVVPLGRWHGLREFQKIQRYRQVQL